MSNLKWRQANGKEINIRDMDTVHLFNSLKMVYNHFAEVYDLPTYMFGNEYEYYKAMVMDDPFGMLKVIEVLNSELYGRRDLPKKYEFIYNSIKGTLTSGSIRVLVVQKDIESGWGGLGCCRMRSIDEEGDWCNKDVVDGGMFCRRHTCVIEGCRKQASAWYPLLKGAPGFCSEHHNEKYAGKYGADFSGPDDFDVPILLL
jgi:hypothetical protein